MKFLDKLFGYNNDKNDDIGYPLEWLDDKKNPGGFFADVFTDIVDSATNTYHKIANMLNKPNQTKELDSGNNTLKNNTVHPKFLLSTINKIRIENLEGIEEIADENLINRKNDNF